MGGGAGAGAPSVGVEVATNASTGGLAAVPAAGGLPLTAACVRPADAVALGRPSWSLPDALTASVEPDAEAPSRALQVDDSAVSCGTVFSAVAASSAPSVSVTSPVA
jgi:hypothetical protein